jgi:sporulation protein YlmC with PRC-barrel domain
MLNNILRKGLFAAAFALAGVATAQVPVNPANPAVPAGQPAQPGQATQQAGNHYRAKQILGSKILIQNNTEIGTVDDIVFDDAGNLEYLIVNNDGRLTTVPFEAAQFDVQKRVATLTITQDQYKTIPTYTTTTYPNFYTPEYRTQIYKTYNITPRELRRIERRTR